MKNFLKVVWKKLPLNFRNKIYPIIWRSYRALCSIFAIQSTDHVIGKVSIPYFAKHYLKRSVSQQGEDLILDRIITRILKWDINQQRTYVDIGAFHPIDHSVTYLLYRRGWNGVVFDPSKGTEKTFKRWRLKDKFVRAVVGDIDGIEVDFFTPKHTFSDQSLINTKYPSNKEDYRVETHRQVSVDKELIRQGVSNIDVLNIDVEGAELEILKNFDFKRFSPSVIAIEIHGNNIEKCLESEEAKLILSNGYRAVGCAVITYFFVREEEISD